MERRKDVGLMKALGGSISRIVALFLAEVGTLGAAGGLIGSVLGVALSRWMGERVFGTLVRARWDRVDDDRGRSLYSLKIADFSGEAEARFAPDELQDGTHMRVRLYKLWGDLLQARNRKQMEELQETVDTGE